MRVAFFSSQILLCVVVGVYYIVRTIYTVDAKPSNLEKGHRATNQNGSKSVEVVNLSATTHMPGLEDRDVYSETATRSYGSATIPLCPPLYPSHDGRMYWIIKAQLSV